MSRRYVCKYGIPSWFSKEGVSPDKSKQRGRRNGYEGVGWVILPMKRVTTAEGRAQGIVNLRGDMQTRVKQSPLSCRTETEEGNLSGYTQLTNWMKAV